MKPSCLKKNRLFFVAGLLLFFACTNTEKKVAAVDRSKLTDEQKRLPENALSAFRVAKGLQVEQFASETRMTKKRMLKALNGTHGLLLQAVN